MLRIELKEERPGYAQLNVAKWKGSSEIEISIQRNQDNKYFAQNDQWHPEPVWHRLNDLTLSEETLVGLIGPKIIDPLVQQVGNVRYMMSVRDSQDGTILDQGPIRLVGNILASSAGGDSSRDEDVRTVVDEPLSQSASIVEPVSLASEADNVEETKDIESSETEKTQENSTALPPIETKKKSPVGLIVGIIVLLLAIAAGAYFFLNKSAPEQPKSACSLDGNSADELAFVQACLKTKPEPKKILEIITEAKQANKCSVAQRLYANQAQGGNVEIALAYAAEYETGSSCFQADKSTAIYWYETALSNDQNNEVAKKKLEELKK